MQKRQDESTKEDEKSHTKKLFDALDEDKSGALNAKELQSFFALKNVTKTIKEVDTLIAKMDKDGSGTLDFKECLELLEKQPDPDEDIRIIKAAFRSFDRDGNGVLSREEFKNIMMKKGDDKLKEFEFQDLMAILDTDGNGEISIQEYITFVKGGY